MSAGRTELWDKPVVSSDDRQGSLAVAAGVGRTDSVVLSFRTPPGLKGWLTGWGQAWDSQLDGFVTSFSIRINGGRLQRFNQLSVQTASPSEAPQQEFEPVPIEQNSLIEVIATVAAGLATNGNFYSRVICKYQNP